jgi:D-alanyl-D-alanine carboxypeptidase
MGVIKQREMIRTALIVWFAAAVFLCAEAAPAAPHPAIVIDAADGSVLHQVDAMRSWYPASLTKMMTLYLTFKALKSARIKLSDRITVSAHAAAQPPTRLGLRKGETLTLEQAILATATPSANDAAVVLAEHVGGNEQAFAEQMTKQAWALGMNGTWFRNASGLPDHYQRTTARDMAILGYRLMHDFPDYFHFFSHRSISYKGRSRSTTNRLVAGYPGADGIKTGFTCDSGYNMVTSVKRNGKRLIGVVLGAANNDDRARRMINLLATGFKKRKASGSGVTVTALENDSNEQPFRVIPDACKGKGKRIYAKSKQRPPKPKEVIIETEGNLPGWGLLLGVYTDRDKAKAKAGKARSYLKDVVKRNRIAILPRRFSRGTSWKTLLVGLDKEEAGLACKHLWRHKMHCSTRSPRMLNRRGFSKR